MGMPNIAAAVDVGQTCGLLQVQHSLLIGGRFVAKMKFWVLESQRQPKSLRAEFCS